MSAHIGDMENLETLQAFETAVSHFQAIFRAQPERLVCDMHPGYLSTQWAERQAEKLVIPLIKVQHHHAHIAAVMAEHQHDGSQPVIGFSFDGTGYGTDGAIWGSEVMLADYHGFERVGHLKYVPLVGGDAAVKRPFRVALSHLWTAGIEWSDNLPCVRGITAVEQAIIRKQLETGLNSVPTSSMGRLFDAAAALIGIRQHVGYEAQAAMELEALAAPVTATQAYPFTLDCDRTPWQLDPTPLLAALIADRLADVPAPLLASRFQRGVAAATVATCAALRAAHGVNVVALGGGVWQNRTLRALTAAQLHAAGFAVLVSSQAPLNDGGLALGQAWLAAQSTQLEK
jgi:hydrogenase maturation protein HypF